MSTTLLIVLALIGGLFGAGGIAALVKVRKEANNISTTSAETAVEAVTSVLNTYRGELDRALGEVASLKTELAASRAETREALKRIDSMEALINSVKDGVDRINGKGQR